MTDNEAIKQLTARINKALGKNPLPIYMNEVNDSNVREIIYTLYHEHTFGNDFMLAYTDAWQQLSYADILQIMKKLAENRGKFLGIEPFLMFFYSYLKIDLLCVYAELDLADKALQHYLLNDFAQRPGRFHLSKNDFLLKLKDCQLDPARLKAIRDRLIAQGATKAEKVDLGPPAQVIGGAKLFHVQCPAPQSWTWAQQIDKVTAEKP